MSSSKQNREYDIPLLENSPRAENTDNSSSSRLLAEISAWLTRDEGHDQVFENSIVISSSEEDDLDLTQRPPTPGKNLVTNLVVPQQNAFKSPRKWSSEIETTEDAAVRSDNDENEEDGSDKFSTSASDSSSTSSSSSSPASLTEIASIKAENGVQTSSKCSEDEDEGEDQDEDTKNKKRSRHYNEKSWKKVKIETANVSTMTDGDTIEEFLSVCRTILLHIPPDRTAKRRKSFEEELFKLYSEVILEQSAASGEGLEIHLGSNLQDNTEISTEIKAQHGAESKGGPSQNELEDNLQDITPDSSQGDEEATRESEENIAYSQQARSSVREVDYDSNRPLTFDYQIPLQVNTGSYQQYPRYVYQATSSYGCHPYYSMPNPSSHSYTFPGTYSFVNSSQIGHYSVYRSNNFILREEEIYEEATTAEDLHRSYFVDPEYNIGQAQVEPRTYSRSSQSHPKSPRDSDTRETSSVSDFLNEVVCPRPCCANTARYFSLPREFPKDFLTEIFDENRYISARLCLFKMIVKMQSLSLVEQAYEALSILSLLPTAEQEAGMPTPVVNINACIRVFCTFVVQEYRLMKTKEKEDEGNGEK